MHRVTVFVATSILIAALVGCGVTPAQTARTPPRDVITEIDVSAVVGDRAVRGLSRAPDGALDLIVDGMGILRVDESGALRSEHRVGEHGLEDRAYNDVASLEHGPFVLLANSEGYLYDPATNVLSVHFCVEPDFEEPIVVQKNDAVAVSGSLILAAPRFYELDADGNEQLVQSALRTYRADDGEPLASVDLTADGLELAGVSLAGDAVVGVQGDELVRFSLDGVLEARVPLASVQDASGVAVDVAGGTVYVADASHDVIRVFALE